MKIARLFIAGLALAGLTTAASAGALDDITKRGELRVAVQTQGPPSRWSAPMANAPAVRLNSPN